MEAKINDGMGGFLHCSVDTEVGNYVNMYNSSDECIEELKPEIINDCESRGYDEMGTERVLNHYISIFSNYGGKWKNEF